ncbi:MAG: hypothetical protein TREMPRED_003343 [Tremellales sp. Tagirdzhanova-0007]|nr:MAG: hypothetical protein TREMPRED_003343 [Tremellales sp. Tagirdzhanova-0007]
MTTIITGSTGKLGTIIMQHLVNLIPPSSITATTRSPSSDGARSLSSLGVHVVYADFSDAASLVSAFSGAEKVLVMSVDQYGDAAVVSHKAAFDAAKKAGIKKIFYTSQIGAQEKSEFPPMPYHWRTEKILEETGVDFTAFKNGFYMGFVPRLIGTVQSTKKLSCPVDGQVAYTSHADMGEAIAKLIASDSHTPTPRYVKLVNTNTWDMNDIASILTKILGQPIEREVISDQQEQDALISKGVPERMIASILGLYRSFRAGEFTTTDQCLSEVLGRECEGIEHFLEMDFATKSREVNQ